MRCSCDRAEERPSGMVSRRLKVRMPHCVVWPDDEPRWMGACAALGHLSASMVRQRGIDDGTSAG